MGLPRVKGWRRRPVTKYGGLGFGGKGLGFLGSILKVKGSATAEGEIGGGPVSAMEGQSQETIHAVQLLHVQLRSGYSQDTT
ncbi:hypothetical protein Tco_1262079 [Tanacetum coccineum]